MSELAKADKVDRLKHFAKDGPLCRLTALFIERLPAMLAGAGAIATATAIVLMKFH